MKTLTLFVALAVSAVAAPSPKLDVAGCDAATLADAQTRFSALADEAQSERDEALLKVARCHYRSGHWREFFGLARYRRAFPAITAASEQLALLEVLGSLRHCRFDRAKEVFAATPASGTVNADRHRIELALAALPGDPKFVPKPGEKGRFDRGVKEYGMHWPVSFDDEKLRASDPFRTQLAVASRCTVFPEETR